MPTTLLLSRQPLTTRPLQEWLDQPRDAVLLTTPKAVAGSEAVLAEHFPRHVLVEDYHAWDTERVVEQVAREHRVDLVASTSESDVVRAARLRERLGLPGQDVASATAYRDKVRMKQLAAGAGIAVPHFAAIDCPADLLDFVEVHGFPVVVKPRLGSGAEGVSILRGDDAVGAFLTAERRSEVPYLPGQWMVESFQTGEFCHVDGIMRAGRVVHGWPGQYTGGLAERVRDELHVGSVLLAPDSERAAVLMQVAAEVVAALPAAPLPLAFHLECWIAPDGTPVLCEIASRAGGALLAHAYERAFGVQLAREGLRAQCGTSLVLDTQPAAPAVATGWVLLPPGHGRFVPPTDPCPVVGAEVELLLEPGMMRNGVAHVADAAAQVFVDAQDAQTVRTLLADVAEWWQLSAQWQ